MKDGKFSLVDLVEFERRVVYLPEALDDICISELGKGHIVDDGE